MSERQNTEDPLAPHEHDPNPEPPSLDATIIVISPAGKVLRLQPAELKKMPRASVDDCFIVSTGHGTSGPFAFSGVTLADFTRHLEIRNDQWSGVEIVSGDGFGTRVHRHEIAKSSQDRPIILCDTIDGNPLSREQGLVRLIVPLESDDALRQVKWVAVITYVK